MATKTLTKNFLTELNRNLLLPETEKKFWRENIETMPDVLLKSLYQKIKASNKTTDKYLKIALKEDQAGNYLKELKAKIKAIKKQATALEESSQKESAEDYLSKAMEKL